MQWLLTILSNFFDRWEKFTGTKTKYYRVGGRVIGVNWSIVIFVVLIWTAMLLFLPGGLLLHLRDF